MQSYDLHIDSDILKDRHPYLDLPFEERYDASRVQLAVFDRAIEKLVGILEMPSLDNHKYRECLVTLNEMVSHQEMKDKMVELGLVETASGFLASAQVEIRNEAVLLLGSMFVLMKARSRANQDTYNGIIAMLFEDILLPRQSCMWAINRYIPIQI